MSKKLRVRSNPGQQQTPWKFWNYKWTKDSQIEEQKVKKSAFVNRYNV